MFAYTIAVVVLAIAVSPSTSDEHKLTKRQTSGPVDWNDPVGLSEAITKMFNGELQFPQYDPTNLPKSTFDCGTVQQDGYYADPELECQVFHVCNSAQQIQETFICPNMTLFSQYYLTCMWAPAVDCAASSRYYPLNANLYAGPNLDYWGNPVPNTILASPLQAIRKK